MNFHESAEGIGLTEEEYLELIEVFIQVGMSDLSKLQSAILEGDAKNIAGAAHSLKGAAGNLGLMRLSEIAHKIEDNARGNRLEEIPKAAGTLQKCLEDLAEILGASKALAESI